MRQEGEREAVREGMVVLILLGAFLTLRGYRSLEGDQAYRFPILLAMQDSSLYPSDPFVGSFGTFNPHRGALAVIGGLGRLLGLSNALIALFVATFAMTVLGARDLVRRAWPGVPGADLMAAVLFLVTLAGNIGTNHLFEPIVLDRQMALGLIWFGLSRLLGGKPAGVAWFSAAIGAGAIIHPTFALQAAVIVAASMLGWRAVVPDATTWGKTLAGAFASGLAILPGLALNLRGSGTLLEGLPVETFRLLSLELQGPQHMLPHLWRQPQWLAWGCFPLLAGLALRAVPRDESPTPPSSVRRQLVVLTLVTLAWLGASWVGVEILGHLRLTLFQPFRMATLCRGLCLLLISGHLARLWSGGGTLGRTRVAVVACGLTGDWSFVVATAFEATMSLGDLAAETPRLAATGRWVRSVAAPVVLVAGLLYLSRHDTESGHVRLIAALALTPLLDRLLVRRFTTPGLGRQLRIAGLCWLIPTAALIASFGPAEAPVEGGGLRAWLVKRCRFGEVPLDDIERLALWCREQTPRDAVFVGPPGPKTFRLWSRRSLAFNRAGSPYDARGLGDWARRFADHVGFPPDPAGLIRAYQADRHGLERGYDRLSPADLAGLAARQGADYVIVRSRPEASSGAFEAHGLRPVHSVGRYILLRVDPSALASGSSRETTRR